VNSLGVFLGSASNEGIGKLRAAAGRPAIPRAKTQLQRVRLSRKESLIRCVERIHLMEAAMSLFLQAEVELTPGSLSATIAECNKDGSGAPVRR